MFERARENHCVEDFLKLSRIVKKYVVMKPKKVSGD